MREKDPEKIFTPGNGPEKNLAVVGCLLFLILLVILSFTARISGDDYYYLWLRNTFGAWDGMIYQYVQWSGRWTAHFIGNVFISFYHSTLFFPVIILSTVSLIYFPITHMFRSIGVNETRFPRAILSILFIACFFFSTPDIGETWFWYIIIFTYLWSLAGWILVIDYIFLGNGPAQLIIAVIASIFIGGASESYALIICSSFILLLTILNVQNIFSYSGLPKILFRNKKINTKIILVVLLIGASFFISVMAPGTDVRQSLLPHTSFADKMFVAAKSFAKIYIRYLPEKFPLLVLLSAPWLIAGFNVRSKLTYPQVKKIFAFISILYVILTAIVAVPTSLVMSEAGPARAWSVLALLSSAYFSFLFLLAGMSMQNIRLMRTILVTDGALIILFLVYTMSKQLPLAAGFSGAYDSRIKKIEAAKNEGYRGVLELEKIPDSGYLYFDELSSDTSYFTNSHIRKGLSLPFGVAVKN